MAAFVDFALIKEKVSIRQVVGHARPADERQRPTEVGMPAMSNRRGSGARGQPAEKLVLLLCRFRR